MVYTISKHVAGVSTTAWKQYLISFFASLPFVTYGVQNGILTAYSNLSPSIEPLNVPWSSVVALGSSLVTAPLHCFIINKYGRKYGIYVVVLLQGTACIPSLLAVSSTSVLIHAALAGISTGGLFIVIPIYVREISADRIRGVTISLMLPMTSAGNAMKLLLSYDMLVYLMVALVSLQLVMVFCIPESPGFFVKTGKLQDAKISAAKLVSLKEDDSLVASVVCQLQEESERAKATGNLSVFGVLKNEIYRDEMKIGFFLNTTTILSGCSIFLDQDKTLAQLNTDIDPQKVLVPVSLLVGGFISTLLVKFVERKHLLTSSYGAMVLSMGTLAVYTQADLTVTSLQWVPVAALATLVVSYGMVWGLPTVVLVEMFNLEIRGLALVLVYVYAQLINLAHMVTVRYVEEYVGVYTLLYVFACVNMLAATYAVSMVPDIRDKSIRQIERQMRRTPLLKFNTK